MVMQTIRDGERMEHFGTDNGTCSWYGHVHVSKMKDQLYKCPHKESPAQTINAKLKVKISILFVLKTKTLYHKL
jgi:hypothetical protein